MRALKGESLPFVGKLPRVSVEQGEGALDLPPDFFPGILLEAEILTSVSSGQPLRLSGVIGDHNVSRVLFQFVDVTGDTISFTEDVESGQFESSILFGPDQIGSYVLSVYMGVSGELLPFVGSFPVFSVTEGEGAFSLPTDFFDGLTLDVGFPTAIVAGQGVTFSGTVADPSIEIIQVVLTDESGTQILFQFNVVDSAFRKGLVYFPSQSGSYTLNVFGGTTSGLPLRGTFAPITIQPNGTEPFRLPVDIFCGVLLDAPLTADFFLGQTRTISGTFTEGSVSQMALQFNSSDGTPLASQIADVTDGQFTVTAPTGTLGTGDYDILIFADQSGGLSFVDSFGPVSILPSQPRIALSIESLSFSLTEIGASSSLTLSIENNGSESLTISQATIDSGPYTVSPNTLDIPAGATSTLTVTFSPTAEGTTLGSLTIGSNDLNRRRSPSTCPALHPRRSNSNRSRSWPHNPWIGVMSRWGRAQPWPSPCRTTARAI